MNVYLASPNTQQQAEHVAGFPVLLSYACWSPWLDKYQASFGRILIDSGSFSEYTTGKKVDLAAYVDWTFRWRDCGVDAIAGLDDIAGDWRKSMQNYHAFDGGFPTFHESDPPELLDDLIQMAQERNSWLGIGMIPPRGDRERWVRETMDRIPEGIHVHGWAMREYTNVRRIDSVDSTNWWRKAMELRTISQLAHLTYGECLTIICKRYERWKRVINEPEKNKELF